ncbi:hypothetical protein LSH36_540g01006 [Paralvinella palmiformis]|uniref:Uncharacterized protein n=1 Tax=Paralvinella palmiformis TaxID=53620 RepID=A0AAD9J7N0_9ANNE|nr:hypothetical protein LSH36_540g01006 [Paralvinella palmiformis]
MTNFIWSTPPQMGKGKQIKGFVAASKMRQSCIGDKDDVHRAIMGYPQTSLHRTRTMSLPNTCTRCATELDSFRGYRNFVTIII